MSCTFTCCCGTGSVCGSGLSMATSVPNPSTCQSPNCVTGDGGAGVLSNALNTIGKWGTAVTGIVAGSKVQGAAIQAKAQTKVATAGISSGALIVVVLIVAVLLWAVLK